MQPVAPRKKIEMMRVATLLDTQTASTNLGDQIIMDAVRTEISTLLADTLIYSVATHEWMGRKSRSLLSQSDVTLVGGTNLLSSRMWFRPLWRLSPLDLVRGYDIILMGVGWYQFQRRPDPYTRLLLRRVLADRGLHAVRDNYTREMLRSIGITNVVNTGCPTLWILTPRHCARVPSAKATHAVTTLNTYMPHPVLDAHLLRMLRERYDRIYFWVQTATDYEYARQFGMDLIYLDPSVAALDELLKSDLSLDYVGNRLHAGIRALQMGRRAIIVEIDNRASEMGRDFGLPTVARSNFEELTEMIADPLPLDLDLPFDAIDRWRTSIARTHGGEE